MSLRLAPIALKQARAWVDRVHSKLEAPVMGRFAVSVESDGERVCVGIAGLPVSRVLAAQGALEITRVASDRTPHAASMTVAALSRAGIALGWRRFVSYTLLGERGTSYTAAGWWPVEILSPRGGDDWAASRGGNRKPTLAGSRVRWEFGPDAIKVDAGTLKGLLAAIAEAADSAGPLPGRYERTLPLFAALAAHGHPPRGEE